MFRAGYMAGNNKLNQRYKRHDEKNMGYGGSLLAKNKWNSFYCIVFFQQKSQAYESTYIL